MKPALAPDSPVVVQAERLDAQAAAWLAERCRLIVRPYDDPAFADALAQADGLIVRTYATVDQRLLAGAPRLKVVGRAGVGLDNIDLAACAARGVAVVHTPDANTQAVVEYVWCLIADVLRPRCTMTDPVDAASWNDLRETTVGSRQFNELTVGILGLGRVGRGVARAAAGFGCRVIYHDLLDIPVDLRAGSTPVSLHDLFSTADIISIHIDGRPSNRNIVNADLIGRMKPDVVFLNTSRGMVADSAAIAAFFGRNRSATACLDVHEPEPFGRDYPPLGLPNVRLYPHLASRTLTAMLNMSWVVRDVMAVLRGEPPRFPAPASAGA